MNVNRNTEYIVKFGKNLRQIRKSKSFTQEALAESIGSERAFISRIERGILNPSISTVKAIADVLEIDIVQLFQFE